MKKQFLLLLVTMLTVLSASAQAPANIRYVSTTGAYANSGRSWASAKNSIQDAINDLVDNNLTGEVWVAAGKYYPTETTESSGSLYYKSFKIPAGITVRGGFAGTETALNQREMKDDNLFGDRGETGNLDGEAARSGRYLNETILCGDLNSSRPAKLTWNPTKQVFDVAFYGNSYHVVWFAMNGFNASGRANPLVKPAKLEGCIVEGGHAYNRDIAAEHPHIAYGGGIYMVANSFVYNCEVRNCDATRNGGGIYMDGGGIVRRTYVHDCQALGLGTEYGIGGGICQNGAASNSKSNPIVVAQSVVTNCVSRLGGGVGINAEKLSSSNKYVAVINSTIVNNNTATVEAGGVYTYKGGGVASSSIVRNRCNGSGVTLGGAVTGRSGGLYSRGTAYVGNTVIWGNTCESNNNIQYATTNISGEPKVKSHFYYNAVAKADITDWSLTEKMNVYSLADENNTTGSVGSKGFPLFFKPTPTAGYLEEAVSDHTWNWQTSSESYLSYAGISTVDLDYEGLTPAPTGISYDMRFGEFNSRPTIGALRTQVGDIAPNTTSINYNGETYTKTFFVDPSFIYKADNPGTNAGNWTTPARFLGIVLDYIEAHKAEYASDKVAIFVKEGTVENTRTLGSARVRETSLEIPSNVTIYGSFAEELKNTDLSSRNPILTPTIISAQLMNDYKFNVAHLISIDGKENIIIDGIKLSFANANSTLLHNNVKDGAAITLKNCAKHSGDHVANIHFRNITVSNCYGDKGTVIYADNASADFENCIFHNNSNATINDNGLVYGINASDLRFDHCNVLRSVGHVSYLDASTKNEWKNSMFYGNLRLAQDNTNSCDTHSVLAFEGAGANPTNLTGERCMFDRKSYAQYNDNATTGFHLGAGIPANSTYHQVNSYPAGTPGVPADLAGVPTHYGLNYVYKSGLANGYPRMVNPTKNAGYSADGDVTYYGRATSFEPHNDNPVVNAASYAGDHSTWGKDLTTITTRDFGGLPDIGAVESHVATAEEVMTENGNPDGQPAYGTITYVRDYGSDMSITDRDGTSWDRAINGNATYTLTGTRMVEDTETRNVHKGFKISNGTYSLRVSNGSLTRSTSANTIFMLCDENGNELDFDQLKAGGKTVAEIITSAKRLKDTSTGQYLYISSTSAFKTAAKPTASLAVATIAGTTTFTIQYSYNGTKRYIRNASTLASTTSTAWTFTEVRQNEEVGLGTYHEEPYTLGTFIGLQYAVNKANLDYTDDPMHTSDPVKAKRQVWVGAGTYAHDPDAGEKSCYIIKDGVEVLGAFPKSGNPGIEQRQPLVSQYVKVQGDYSPSEYETIIQPKTTTIQSTTARRVLGQPYDCNPFKAGGHTTYQGAVWDGFTVRFGVISNANVTVPSRTGGGAGNGGGGVVAYDNVTLRNLVITNNTILRTAGVDCLGGGAYINGATVEQCYLINNLNQGWSGSAAQTAGECYGGGMTIENGTVYNSVIANNRCYAQHADGGGIFLYNANFFNNTIANNSAYGTSRCSGGIAVWTNTTDNPNVLNVHNTISVNNEGYIKSPYSDQASAGDKNFAIQAGGNMNLWHCISENTTNSQNQSTKGWAIIKFENSLSETTPANLFQNLGHYVDRGNNTTNISDFKNCDLRLKQSATAAINTGDDAPTIGSVTYDLSEYTDMDYTERIQDCRIDIGAYEFNGATAIAADETTNANQAIFYVTPLGYGGNNASSPQDAACASKLQKVIDAAGRYKLLNPEKQVIVKVANSYDLYNDAIKKNAVAGYNPGDDGYIDPTNFTYYATRTTDKSSTDTRMWSTMIPRGVEVWGGYTDKNSDGSSWTNAKNGFQTRDITANPVYFDSYFYNKDMKINATTYHVVTFTERIYDVDGNPYLKADFNGSALAAKSSYDGHADADFLSMSDYVSGNVLGTKINGETVSNRAVLDGIFVTGGNADGKTIAGSANLNANGYGGAAIVTDYAYVRNCIITNNNATNGGGLAMTSGALVSGSLFIENSADNQGGGLYVFENGTTLSNGITNNSDAPDGQAMDFNMAHILTSTIVNNQAKQGGGVWFTGADEPNVRLNSVVIWQNTAGDQANVYGTVNPDQPADDQRSSQEFYPFAYSAIQDLRASGTNNQNVNPISNQGVRFVDGDYDINAASPNPNKMAKEDEGASSISGKYADFGYWGLTNYSMLNNAGMPIGYYNQLKDVIAIGNVDFMGVDKTIDTQGHRKFIEIGARTLDKQLPEKQLMLRLFVAKPDNTNTEMANKMLSMGDGAAAGSAEEYYSQEGSTFAFPMQTIQDALDYIKMWRTDESGTGTGRLNQKNANNLPFEIFVAKGEWNPTQDLNGNTENALGATFAIPEGVSIYGGFDAQGGAGTYYGRYLTPNGSEMTMTDGKSIDQNVTPVANKSIEVGPVGGKVTIQQWSAEDICNRRATYDINGNSIIEPWELKNQTIFSGDAVGAENKGVYHVITVVPDENVVGALPKASLVHGDVTDSNCNGYHDHEEGQIIRLNGIVVKGGYAYNYVENALDDYGTYTYYQGGGLFVDGNRHFDKYNGKTSALATEYEQKHRAVYAVGYRDIPVSIVNCKFQNNQAGYGGAISTNTTLDVFASAFEQNLAMANSESAKRGAETKLVEYPGEGGAIHATHQLTCFNTLFANNEARNAGLEIQPQKHGTFRVLKTDPNLFGVLRGCGGAIHAGLAANLHVVNCNLVKNKANMYPAIYTMNPTRDLEDEDHFPSGPFVMTPDYSQVINTVAWGNEVNPEMMKTTDNIFKFASKLMINAGKWDRENLVEEAGQPGFVQLCEAQQSFVEEYCPTNQEQLNEDRHGGTPSSPFQECVFFSAYEEGCGFTPHNENDFRLLDYKPFIFATNQLRMYDPTGADHYLPYQNCNIQISSDNAMLEGPNFVNPSVKAGVDGFTESADWSPARINNLTDNGSGMIKQTITNNGTDYECSFDKYTSAPSRSVHASGAEGYTSEQAGDYDNVGGYTMTHYVYSYPDYAKFTAIGTQKYMQSARDGDTEIVTINGTDVIMQRNLPRISYDPNPTHNQTFIDIGVYEYQHARLNPSTGSEIDLLWVSTAEKPENGAADGSDWDHPTSDLQRAIETLLASRNNHRKEIRIMDGEYTPTYSFNHDGEKYLAYYINTLDLNANTILPVNSDSQKELFKGVQSLTIKGGYSKDLPDTYDPKQYRTIIHQQESASANTDHLFFIADATQRYGYDDASATLGHHYGEDNNWGAWPNVGDITKSLPIHFDGLTLVNDKIKTVSKGAAIYYADYKVDDNHKDIPAMASEGTITKTVTYDLNGDITSVSGLKIEDTPKFILSKSHIIGSGKKATGTISNAVYLGSGGGRTLIYNNVFHSNPGMPLRTMTPATTINNTFALNDSYVDLADGSSVFNSVFWRNFLSRGSYGEQVRINNAKVNVTTAGTYFRNNALTGGNTTAVKYDEWEDEADHSLGHTVIYNNNYNVGLSNDNKDLVNGPNFVNPYLEATTTEQFLQRDFDLKPSFRLLNRGNNDLYVHEVAEGTPGYLAQAVNILDLATLVTDTLDALGQKRFKSVIDLGAIEYQYDLQHVLYVDPNRSSVATSKGLDWNNPLGYGSLQDAIDMVGISYAMDPEKTPCYVFVKGGSATNKNLNLMERITLRDGVQVYGSITSSYSDYHDMKDPDDPTKYKFTKDGGATADIDTYVKSMLEQREGVASSSASRTRVAGVKTDVNSSFTGVKPAIFDGFVVTNPEPATESVVNINSNQSNAVIVLRNLIVTGNDLSSAPANTNVVQLNRGLLYEALLFGNKEQAQGATLKVSENGYAVNVTAEGLTRDKQNYTDADADGYNIFNSVVNSISNNDANAAFAGISNKHISGHYYNIDDEVLNYQLVETSKYIDQCSAENPLVGVEDRLAPYINYETDRDLLGNPRLLAGVTSWNPNGTYLDRGAFETWRVDNSFVCGDHGTIIYKTPYNTDETTYGAIKKQFYPHDGSVVYVMDGQSLVIDPINENEVKPTPHNPGFMLMKQGSSFYGNGRPVTCSYLAVERSVRRGGDVVSVPYSMHYNEDVTYPGTTTVDGLQVLALSKDNGSAFTYNGADRSSWQYDFRDQASPCWDALPALSSVPATIGALYVPHDNTVDTYGTDDNLDGTNDRILLRFTGKGISMNDYIYTEAANDGGMTNYSKSVTLYQHNAGGRDYNANANTGHNADYTDAEDMGWNLIGLPYLVSNYQPQTTIDDAVAAKLYLDGAQASAVTGKYMLHIPHTLWMYYDGKAYADGTPMTPGTNGAGDGGFYSIDSWDASTDFDIATDNPWHVSTAADERIWMGEGFFTQTATFNDTEALTFYRPVVPAWLGARTATFNDDDEDDNTGNGNGNLNTRYYVTTDIRPADEHLGKQIVATRYYTADGVQHSRPVHGVTIQVDIYDDGSRQTRKYTKKL